MLIAELEAHAWKQYKSNPKELSLTQLVKDNLINELDHLVVGTKQASVFHAYIKLEDGVVLCMVDRQGKLLQGINTKVEEADPCYLHAVPPQDAQKVHSNIMEDTRRNLLGAGKRRTRVLQQNRERAERVLGDLVKVAT